MNQVTVAGHLGADPEVRFTSSGQKVTTLRLAARARRTQKDKEETIWWKVTLWGEAFDKMLSYLKKGSAVIVMGDLNKPEIFTDKEGRPQVSVSMTAYHLTFSPFGKGGESSSHQSSHGQSASEEHHEPALASSHGKAEHVPFNEDEIPF